MHSFDAGAMEHLGSIVYPLFACNGALTYETLMAHELAHHGGETRQRPMMPRRLRRLPFSEFLFMEGEYGAAHNTQILTNHEIALHYDHVFDGGYQPLSPMPLTLHSEELRAPNRRTLFTRRSYMGDSLSSPAESFVQSHYFKTIRAAICDYLSDCSGMI
jgi:hypothetical protein